jgi:hypothetical protein
MLNPVSDQRLDGRLGDRWPYFKEVVCDGILPAPRWSARHLVNPVHSKVGDMVDLQQIVECI